MTFKRTALVTGFPSSLLARRIVEALLTEQADLGLRLVVQEGFLGRAEQELAALEVHPTRFKLLVGDAAAMDLGLSGREFTELASEVNVVHHCAAISYFGVEKGLAEHVNIEATREILELADAADHLERLVHWSTALVSGRRRGYLREDELDGASGFRNVIESSRFRAEQLVQRASERLPITVLRPSIIVGDSRNGVTDRMDGPYLLIMLLLNTPAELPMPLPGRGDTPLNLVPIDHVVRAGLAIARDRRGLGRTFHIVDPDPLTAREAFDLIAKALGRSEPRGFVPANLATTLLKAPGLERFANVPRAFLEQLATEVVYDDRQARAILEVHNIRCPSLEEYVEVMVEYVRSQQAAKRSRKPLSEEDAHT